MKLTSSMLSTLLVGCVWIAASALNAQDTSKTQVTPGATSVTTQVDRAEVVYVSGNDLVVKMENGEVKHFVVPDSVTVMVDGKELTVHDLQPGMELQRTITTTQSADTVTTVRTITGRVVQVTPPNSVILALPDGNKRYQIPKDQVFMIDGQKKTAFDLRPGMNVTATVVTTAPAVVTSQTRTITGTAPPPPPKPETPPPQSVLLIEVPVPAPAPAAAAPPEPPPSQLPKTASPVPLAGLIGLLLLGVSLSLRMLRHRA